MRSALPLLLLLLGKGIIMGAEAYPHPELLIEPETLAKSIESFVVLDARDVASYAELHAGRARWVNAMEWARAFGDGNDVQGWSQRIGKLGIDADTKVVVYDNSYNKDAARIWWILRYWGVRDVRLLNGGWAGWLKARPGFDAGTPEPPTPKEFTAQPIAKHLATKERLLTSLKTSDLQIIDSRSDGEFCGDDAHHNRRAGAIPGAKHLEWSDLLDHQTGRFKSAAELSQLFAEAKIDLHAPSATYCQSGARASVMAFAMELMGNKDVSNYYKSWSEWGNVNDTPIVLGKKSPD